MQRVGRQLGGVQLAGAQPAELGGDRRACPRARRRARAAPRTSSTAALAGGDAPRRSPTRRSPRRRTRAAVAPRRAARTRSPQAAPPAAPAMRRPRARGRGRGVAAGARRSARRAWTRPSVEAARRVHLGLDRSTSDAERSTTRVWTRSVAPCRSPSWPSCCSPACGSRCLSRSPLRSGGHADRRRRPPRRPRRPSPLASRASRPPSTRPRALRPRPTRPTPRSRPRTGGNGAGPRPPSRPPPPKTPATGHAGDVDQAQGRTAAKAKPPPPPAKATTAKAPRRQGRPVRPPAGLPGQGQDAGHPLRGQGRRRQGRPQGRPPDREGRPQARRLRLHPDRRRRQLRGDHQRRPDPRLAVDPRHRHRPQGHAAHRLRRRPGRSARPSATRAAPPRPPRYRRSRSATAARRGILCAVHLDVAALRAALARARRRPPRAGPSCTRSPTRRPRHAGRARPPLPAGRRAAGRCWSTSTAGCGCSAAWRRHDRLCRRIAAEAGVEVLAVDYRLRARASAGRRPSTTRRPPSAGRPSCYRRAAGRHRRRQRGRLHRGARGAGACAAATSRCRPVLLCPNTDPDRRPTRIVETPTGPGGGHEIRAAAHPVGRPQAARRGDGDAQPAARAGPRPACRRRWSSPPSTTRCAVEGDAYAARLREAGVLGHPSRSSPACGTAS